LRTLYATVLNFHPLCVIVVSVTICICGARTSVPLASVGPHDSDEREKIPSFLDDRRSPNACLLRPPSSQRHSPNVDHPWPGRHPSLPSPSPSSRATLSLPNTEERAKGAVEGGASPAGCQRGRRKRDFSLSATGRVFYAIRGKVGPAGTSAVMCAAGEGKSRFLIEMFFKL
jgi:hypothetical protein